MSQNIYYDLFSEPLRIDEVTASLTYLGFALNLNVDETASVWRIKRIQQVGTVWEIKYADGNGLYDNVWADRSLLTYK